MAVNWGSVFEGTKDALSKPENQSALIKSGFDLAGSAMAGNAAYKRDQADKKYAQRNSARDRQFDLLQGARGQENADFQLRQGQQDEADQTVLGAMGRSPLAFQRERMKMDAIANALEAGGPSNLSAHLAPWAQGMDMSAFRPSAAAEAPYWQAVAQASKGRFHGAGLDDAYGSSGAPFESSIMDIAQGSGDQFGADWAAHGNAIGNNFDQAFGMASQDFARAQEEAEQKSGGGFWGKLGGIAKIAVPIALAATGVGLPAAAAITAATNVAGSKMQGKGWGGSLLDGAMGAGGAALNSALLGKAGSSVFGQASNARLDPTKIAGAGLGSAGRTGLGNVSTILNNPAQAPLGSRAFSNVFSQGGR